MSADYLLLRRDGGLWAAAGASVRDVRTSPDGVRLRLTGGGVLDADEVAGVARDLDVRACGAVLRACWHEPARGLAIYGGEPCVVIDPAAPPRALRPRDLSGTDAPGGFRAVADAPGGFRAVADAPGGFRAPANEEEA